MAELDLLTNAGGKVALSDSDLEELRLSLHGPLLAPDDAGYDEARHVFNGAFSARRPGAILRCRSTGDVVDAVKFAAAHDLVVAIRGGGHNVAGKSTSDGGLLIDMSPMNGVFVDRKTNTVTVQGGATWGDVDREAQTFGLAVPGGVVSTTGVAGLTLNGGVGWLRNKYGLSCDNLVGADVVTASGEVVTASETENADLLWALRGGGGNFGVVTTFHFRAHPVGPVVAAAIPVYALEDAHRILPRWRDWVLGTPEEVSALVVMWTAPIDPHLPEPIQGRRVLILGSVYAGDVDTGLAAMQAPREFGTPIFDMSGPHPFRELQAAFDPFFPVNGTVSSYWKSSHLRELSQGAIDALVEAALGRTSEYSIVNLWHMGGAVRRGPEGGSAFNARHASFLASADANWLDKSDGAQHIAWARRAWDRLQPFSDGNVYLNFLGQEESDADSLVRAAFGSSFDRLVEVKTKYDPGNLFRLNQNIKPREMAGSIAEARTSPR